MELHAYTRTIADLFSVNKKYVVPRFQREYSWTNEEVNYLYKDIISNISLDGNDLKNEEYFIGSLVLVGEDTSTEFQIVDGQQRLTTITIFLSALVESLKSIGEQGQAEALYNNYIEGKDDNNDPFFKLVNENPKPFLQKQIQHITKEEVGTSNKEEEKLLNTFNYFKRVTRTSNLKSDFSYFDQLGADDTERTKKLIKAIQTQILRYLKVIYITVKEEEEAYAIFETLNARGMNLSPVDLIKNDIFKNLRRTHPNDDAKSIWKGTIQELHARKNRINLDTYFRHYWLSKYGFNRESKIYKAYQKKRDAGEINHRSFIDEFKDESKYYNIVSNPEINDWPQQQEKQIFKSLKALEIFNVTQVKTFLLALLNQRKLNKVRFPHFKEAVENIEKFHFIFTAVTSSSASGLEGKFSKFARDLRAANTRAESKTIIDDLSTYLRSKIPDKPTFTDGFKKLSFKTGYSKDKKLIQYIFSKMERYLTGTNELEIFQFSLEHIESQSGSTFNNFDRMGNLFPLSEELNSDAGNETFVNKVPIYQRSSLKVVEHFISNHGTKTNWTEPDIETRTLHLVDLAYDTIWRF